jgi:hypothetical protein
MQPMREGAKKMCQEDKLRTWRRTRRKPSLIVQSQLIWEPINYVDYAFIANRNAFFFVSIWFKGMDLCKESCVDMMWQESDARYEKGQLLNAPKSVIKIQIAQ